MLSKNSTQEKLHKIYSVKQYQGSTHRFIAKNFEEYKINELIKTLLENDKCYHVRIYELGTYIFFGDLDGYTNGFNDFAIKLIDFLVKKYNVIVVHDDIFYTSHEKKPGYHHYSITKINCSCAKLLEIHSNFKKYLGTIIDCVDTSIYSNHWFRLPLQSKESIDETKHIITKGTMKDFIPDYIPEHSVNINDNKFVNELNEKIVIAKKKSDKKNPPKKANKLLKSSDVDDGYLFIESDPIIESEKSVCTKQTIESNKPIKSKQKVIKLENKVEPICIQPMIKKNEIDVLLKKSKYYENYAIYKNIFDTCYKSIRYDIYKYWSAIGMALYNIYGVDAFDLFNYFSAKSKKYEGPEVTLIKMKTFKQNDDTCYGIPKLYEFAKEDNLEKYKQIMYKNSVTFMENDFAEKIFELAGDNFIYVKLGDGNYQLYCYNGKYWEADSLELNKYISTGLYNYYCNLLVDVYWNAPNFKQLKSQVDSLKTYVKMENIIKLYKNFGVKQIEFDNKCWLLGFTNKVYDLKLHKFRNYEKDDYVSMTTGYNWIEPTDEQMQTMTSIIEKIMPIVEERQFYLTILATAISGFALERFIIFCGNGRNGKGLIDDLLLIALGMYGIAANNSILFEKCKTGSNPEKANLHRKRLVIFKEPSEKNKFENSVVKELTGGGKFSARSHHEKTTEKILNNTTICECNKKPLFAEEPTHAEVERIIDIPFRSTFTTDKEQLNDELYIFECKQEYKEETFQHSHKTALLKILMIAYESYAKNNCVLDIPLSIKQRTAEYLEKSCNLLQWFKENYTLTTETSDVVRLKDLFNSFKEGEYYNTLSKFEKRKLNYAYFIEYFTTNIMTRKYYKERHVVNYKEQTNVLYCWKKIQNEDNSEDNELNGLNELDVN